MADDQHKMRNGLYVYLVASEVKYCNTGELGLYLCMSQLMAATKHDSGVTSLGRDSTSVLKFLDAGQYEDGDLEKLI